jgi:hypothetical protein
LTLLPFALVNVAMWSRPELSTAGPRRTASAVVVRLAALLLTAFLVATACGIAIDLVAWQCFRGGVASCPSSPSQLDFLGRGTFSAVGHRLALAQLVPLALLVVLFLLSRTTTDRYESYDGNSGTADHRAASRPPSPLPLLARPQMWSGFERVRALAACHLTVGLAVTMAYTAWPMRQLTDDRLFDVLAWTVVAAAVVATLLTCAGVYHQIEYDEPPTRDPRITADQLWRVAQALLGATLGLLVVHTGRLLTWTGAVRGQDDDLPGVGAMPMWLAFLLFASVAALVGLTRTRASMVVVLLLLVGAVTWYFWQSPGPGRTFAVLFTVLAAAALAGAVAHRTSGQRGWVWDGAGPAILVGSAVVVAVLFSSGATMLVADRLNGDPGPSELASDAQPLLEAQRFMLATGSTLTDGVLEIEGENAVLRAGVVTTEALRAVDGVRRVEVPSRALGTGTLTVPDGLLRVEDSCVVEDGQERPTDGALVELPRDGDVPRPLQVRPGAVEGCGDTASPTLQAVSTSTSAVLVVPAPFSWFTAVLPPLVVGVVLVIGLCRGRFGARVQPLLKDQARTDFPCSTSFAGRAARARTRAAFAHRAESLIGWLAFPVVAAAVVVAAGCATGRVPSELVTDGRWATVVRWSSGTGTYLALGLAVGLVLLGARMRASEPLRRVVGVLWDVTTFFPRNAHPFAPPCYAERVVPEITHRVRWWAHQGGKVVLSGHSQGSTIAVAVLEQLRGPDLDRVHFVSYGSQLRSHFGRAFPAVFGAACLGGTQGQRRTFSCAEPDLGLPGATAPPPAQDASLLAALGGASSRPRWRNLYRRSDPLGLRVYDDADGENPVDVYVPELPIEDDGDPTPELQTHSRYPDSPQYAEVLKAWGLTSQLQDLGSHASTHVRNRSTAHDSRGDR